MPTFLNPWNALLATAITAPLLLLLYFLRLRRLETPVSSTFLWKKAVQDMQVNAPFQRLRRNLLLLLQMIFLLAIGLALARPLINATTKIDQKAVILIDRSASMNVRDVDGKTRLEDAKKRAADLVDTMSSSASAKVIAFDDSAQVVQPFTSDRALLKRAIEAITPSDRTTNLQDAYRVAEAQVADPDQGERLFSPNAPAVWVFSDGRVADPDKLFLRDSELHYEKVGSDTAKNVSIVNLSAGRNPRQPTRVQVNVHVADFGPDPVEDAAVTFSVNGKVSSVSDALTLLPESWTEDQKQAWEKAHNKVRRDVADYTNELPAGALIRVEQTSRQDDALSADDAVQVVVDDPRPLRLLVVTDGNFWLSKGIDSLHLQNAAYLTPDDYESQMKDDPGKLASSYDAIIFDRHSPAAVPSAGNFVYFGCVPPQGAIHVAKETDGTDSKVKGVFPLYFEQDKNHPGYELFTDITSLDKLYVGEMLKLQLAPEAQVLMQGAGGPMIVRAEENHHVDLVVSFCVEDSHWPFMPSYPIFINNLAEYLALSADKGKFYLTGSSVVVPRQNVDRLGDVQSIKLIDPTGAYTTVPVNPAGELSLGPLEKVGVWKTEPPIPQFDRIAVNLLNANESNLLPADELKGGKDPATPTHVKKRVDLWWWIITCVATPLCLTEWWFYARRVRI